MSTWFKSWFNTPYYHKLYKHRDDTEARFFIQNLVQKLNINDDSLILDLACGRGRHAKFLNKKGYRVIGLDLSAKNIEFAKAFENENLHFEVGDMREPFGENRFDYIFNLFTSFGYFNNTDDNIRACKCIAQSLKPKATLVLDFMNVHKIKLGLVKEELVQASGIDFHLSRSIRDGNVIKRIQFTDKGKGYDYEEIVQLLQLEDFERIFAASGLHINNVYGDFDLNSYEASQSERLILFASRK